jgi:hypothetical protein
MSRGRKLALLGVVLPAILAWSSFFLRTNPEPTYQGKPVEYWLNSYLMGNGQNAEAEAAFGSIGAAAVPFIFRAVKRSDSTFQHVNMWLRRNPYVPDIFKEYLPQPRQNIGQFFYSFQLRRGIFRAIGSSCVPHLMRGLQDRNADVWLISLRELGAFPSSRKYADQIVAALISGLANSKATVRVYAAMALEDWQPQSHAAIPALIGALSDTDRDRRSPYVAVRAMAARTLGNFGSKAELAVPKLVSLLHDGNPGVSSSAAIALWQIQRRTTDTVPVLISIIQSRPVGIDNISCIRALGEMGSSARAAIPTLRELKERTDLDKVYAEPAEQALTRIAAEGTDESGAITP